MQKFEPGTIAVATYSYNSQHNYWLVVTKRTAKTVSFARIERAIVSDDGYGQNGKEVPRLVDGKPIIRTDQLGNPETYNNKRIKLDRDGNETAKFADYVSDIEIWDGTSSRSFYTD